MCVHAHVCTCLRNENPNESSLALFCLLGWFLSPPSCIHVLMEDLLSIRLVLGTMSGPWDIAVTKKIPGVSLLHWRQKTNNKPSK